MNYFKNINEFIKYFSGTTEYLNIWQEKKFVTKIKYHVKYDDILIVILKHKGKYDVSINTKNESNFVCNSGTWEKIERELFKLDLFTDFLRDKKLESILN